MTHVAARWRIRLAPAALPFGLVLAAMILAAVNYSNNLVYFFFFWIGATAGLSLMQGVRNLQNLSVQAGDVESAFAGESVQLRVLLRNESTRTAFDVHLEIPASTVPASESGPWEVRARDTLSSTIGRATVRRGRDFVPHIVVWSSYPLGLFRVEREFSTDLSYLVYPRPHGQLPWPTETIGAGLSTSRTGSDGDDFAGYRNYRPGESPRRVDWRAVARGRPLMLKDFSGGGGGAPLFDPTTLSGLSGEAGLEQVARWIVEAEAKEQAYAVRMGGRALGPAVGRLHRDQCLSLLAETPR